MPVSSTHPLFDRQKDDWEMIRDSLEGERAVKKKRDQYLPIPPGMGRTAASREFLDTGKNIIRDAYSFYLSFAEFPEILGEALMGFQGIIHDKAPRVELPPKMQYLLEDATPQGEPLDVLWSMITANVLKLGRIGLLCDIGSDDLIRIVTYPADTVINWSLQTRREGGNPDFVVVQEAREVPVPNDPFQTKGLEVWRELRVFRDEGVYRVRTWVESTNGGQPKIEQIEGETDETGFMTPELFGQTFPEIPLTIVNATHLGFKYGPMPLRPLARRVHSIYRLTADYRRALYVKGDPQAVITGVEDEENIPDRIGGGEIWVLPAGADAQYLDIDGNGIPLMKEEIDAQYERFYQEGGRLLDTADRGPESGEALRRRQAAQQVTLKDISVVCANGVQEVLRKIAAYLGENPENIHFEADTDFTEPILPADELVKYTAAKIQGAPMSWRSLHSLMMRGRLTEKDFEQEMEEIDDEGAELDGLVGTGQEIPEDDEQ